VTVTVTKGVTVIVDCDCDCDFFEPPTLHLSLRRTRI
jgi:hypothetical protein